MQNAAKNNTAPNILRNNLMSTVVKALTPWLPPLLLLPALTHALLCLVYSSPNPLSRLFLLSLPLSPLCSALHLLQSLLDRLLAELGSGGAAGYGLRRGSAYGVSGVVKGLGIASLKGFGVLEALKSMVENKKDPEAREGGLQAFECLCEKLGRLFEPYVIHILPLLLQCFGDPSPQVRAAAGWVWGPC